MTFLSRSVVAVYITTANNKGMYTKLWTEDDKESQDDVFSKVKVTVR